MSGVAEKQMDDAVDPSLLKCYKDARFNPIDFPIAASTPRRWEALTTWMGHVPFAMTLVELVRPRVLVELGTVWGISYCAFCQAVKELRLNTRCYAVGNWAGEPQGSLPGQDIFTDLKTHHDQEYSLFSQLVPSTVEQAEGKVVEPSIDILHLAGFASYASVKRTFATWLPRMSRCGVVLVHDTEVREREAIEVWRFWDEIKDQYPHFEFYHGCGLGVLFVGDDMPARLQALVGTPSAEAARIREFFKTLGTRLTEWNSICMRNNNLQEQLHAKAEECELMRHRAADEVARAQQHLQYAAVRYRMVDYLWGKVKAYSFLAPGFRFAVRCFAAILKRARAFRAMLLPLARALRTRLRSLANG